MTVDALAKMVSDRKDLKTTQKLELLKRLYDRLDQRTRNLKTLAETYAAVQESEDLVYMQEHGELPPPEWRSSLVANLMAQPA
jgi:hypothetical protein